MIPEGWTANLDASGPGEGLLGKPANKAAGPIAELLAGRHSCRGFRPDPVPRAIIDQMLTLAQQAASWCNLQPWHVFVSDKAATDRLRQHLLRHAVATGHGTAEQHNDAEYAFPPEYRGLYKSRQRECGQALYRAVGIERGDRNASTAQALRNYAMFDAPHLLVMTTPRELGVYGAIDCGGYAAMFMLAAQSLGLATIAQAALAMSSELLREFFEIPKDRIILFGISFGFEDDAHPANGFRTTRAALSEAVSWTCG